MKKLSNQTAPALLPEQELPADAVISLPRRIDAGGENRLRWWRTMPPGMFTSDDRQALQDILSATAIIGEREWKYARRGCAASAFGIALPMIPIVRPSTSSCGGRRQTAGSRPTSPLGTPSPRRTGKLKR